MHELHWYQVWEAKLLVADHDNYRRYRFIRPLTPPTIEHSIAMQDLEKAEQGLDKKKKTVARVRQIWPHDVYEELNKGAK